jgi:PHB/PHA accumulation regulator DNA-binding domain
MLSPDRTREPIVIRFRKCTPPKAVLVDADLDAHSLEELSGWVAAGADVVVIDDETGEDITRVMLANWKDGYLVDPIGKRDA